MVLSVGAAALVFYAVLCGLLYVTQDKLLYLPTPETTHPEARDLRLKCGDATVKVWELHPNARAALVYFGGNGEDVGANLPDFDAAFPDVAVYLVNYRGYGGSTGSPSEAALTSDAETIYDWIAARHSPVTVIGRSLGSGVAISLASRRPVERLAVITPYDSVANVAADRFSWFPVRWLIRDRYDSLPRIGKVRAPVMVVVAERDEVISRARSDALIAAIPAGIGHVVVIAGATHNNIETFPAYLSSLKAFVGDSGSLRSVNGG
jgi:uncharacterized protein